MRRRRVVKVLAAVLAVLVLALVGGYWYERPLLLTGTGYAAHNACAIRFVADRPDGTADLPPNALVPYLRTSVDRTAHTASTKILGALAGQKAWYTTGYGCTLGDRPPTLNAVAAVSPIGNPFTNVKTPTAPAQIQQAIGRAFGDDLDATARAALGTRAVLVVKDGKLIAERYAPGFTPTTRQLGWSMSKSVANLLVGRLVLAGAVKITDDHLRPEWRDQRTAITIDELMRMTSGLAWDETYALGTPITTMLYREPDMAKFVASQPLAHPPGSYQQYSSGSTNLLCSVLLAKTRTSANLPRTEVFAPLGLSSAVLEPDGVGTPVCSSYLWATPRDWAAIGQFALQKGSWNGEQLLPPDWIANSTKAIEVKGEETGYGAGWWVNRLANGSTIDDTMPADTFYADGHDGQRVYVVPSANLVVVRLGFSPTIDTDEQLRVTQLVHSLTS